MTHLNQTAETTPRVWTTSTSLPAAVVYSQAIVTEGRVYLLGGVVNYSPSSVVHTAPINERVLCEVDSTYEAAAYVAAR